MQRTAFAMRPVMGALGLYVLLSLGSQAQAQSSAPPQASAAAPDVVVTATRREIAAEKVGVSLTVVTAKDLAVLAPQRLEDLQGLAPNVYIGEEVGAPNQSLIFIRGQGYADVEMDQAPPVGVIQDGVAFGTSTGQLASLFDVCSVEVDRGPQGIFYGKNTTAGLINITRCAPTRKFGADIQAGYGTYNDAFVRGVFNAPIGDKGGFKLAAQYHSDDGYVKNVFDGKHVGQDHMFAINAVLNYDVTNWLNASLSYDHISESGGGNPVQYGNILTAGILGINAANDPYYNSTTGSPIGLKPREVDTRPGSTSDTYQNDVLSLTLKAQTPFGDVVSQTAYLDQSDFDAQDYDGTCLSYPGCSGPGAGGNALLTATVPLPPPLAPLVIPLSLEAERTQTYKQFTQEERLAGTYGPFDYTIGAFYYHHTFTLREDNNLVVVETDQHSAQRDDSWSEFGNLDWNLTSTIKLSGGIRNISETKDAFTSFDVGGFPILAQPFYNFNHTWNHVVTRFNAQWQATPETLLYANRSEGFRSGGFSVRGTLSESVPGQTNYAPNSNLVGFLPETNVTYEIGAKNHWFGNSLIFNVDGFINDITDYQQTSVIETTGYGPGTNTYVINIPKVEIKGLEFDLSARIGHWIPALEGLTVSGNAGFQSGSIKNGKVNGQEFALSAGGNGGAAGSIADLTGTTLARLPSNSFTVRGVYTRALGPDDGKLTATVGYAWISKYSLGDFTPQTPDFQPSYGLLDASATYNWKNYYVKVSGKNLTNSDYRQFSLPTVFIQSWAPPATAEIEFGAKF